MPGSRLQTKRSGPGQDKPPGAALLVCTLRRGCGIAGGVIEIRLEVQGIEEPGKSFVKPAVPGALEAADMSDQASQRSSLVFRTESR